MQLGKFMYKYDKLQLPATFNGYFKHITNIHPCSKRQTITRQFPEPKAHSNSGFKMLKCSAIRTGLNEPEAPGKVVTARPPKRLAQLRSVLHALVSTLQKYRSKTSKLIRFCSLHCRDNWGWPHTAVCMWLICSNRKLYHKKRFLLPWHHTTIFLVIDSLTIFSAQTVHSHMHWGKICLQSLADHSVHRLEKMFSTKYHAKATWSVLFVWGFAMGAL